MATETFNILNRRTGVDLLAARIECDPDAPTNIKLGLAVRVAVKSGADLRHADLRRADLSGANLSGADLSGADLRHADLRRANLRDADLSGADLRHADLRDADLIGANLIGADLSSASLRDTNLIGADMRHANLSSANLSGADLSGANLRDADLRHADLRRADLLGADLSGADLRDADLIGANLIGANLRHGDLVPIIKNIHSAVYEAASAVAALDMEKWHTCGTTHCRAGWVTTLAGKGGKALESIYGTAAAAALIYQASDPTLERIPDFYALNADALADMRRLADAEVAS